MIGVEFRKQVWRLRTYLALGLMVVIPALMTLAFKLSGGPKHPEELNLFSLATRSGLNMPLASLSLMSGFLLPLIVSLFAGSAIAEEASWGSLRYLLIRPVSRSRLLAGKLAVVVVLGVIATLLITITGLLGGIAAFGWHPVVIPSIAPLSVSTLSPGEAFGRLVAATFYVAWCMIGVLTFAFMLSTITDAALGAVSGGIGLTIVSEIMNAIPAPALSGMQHFLPTHYWTAWEGLFRNPMTTSDMARGILLQVPYVLAFLVFAWWWFHRKDIVS